MIKRMLIFVLVLAYYGVRCETLLDGNLTVAGLFTIQNSVNGQCSGISPSSVKILEAVKWIFKNLNEKNYIPGVTIGFDAWPTCQMVTEDIDRTVDLMYTIRQDKQDTAATTSPLAALIGPNYSNEAEKTSYLLSSQRTDDRLLQLGLSSTAASLSNSDIYSNFYRVVPSDTIQIEVMVSLMVELEWNYIAILYDDGIYGTEGKTALIKKTAANSICVAATFAIPTGAINVNDLKGMLNKIIQNTESPISGVVVFTSDTHVKSIMSTATALQGEITDQISFIISEAMGLSDSYLKDSNGDVYKTSKGVYVVSPPQLEIDEFELYWKGTFRNVSTLVDESHTNKWLRNVFHYYSGCLPTNNSQDPRCSELDTSKLELASQKSAWTSYAVKAAYVVADVIKKLHNSLCSGKQGLCTEMKTALHTNKASLINKMNGLSVDFGQFPFVPETLKNISFSFPGINDAKYQEGFPDYEVYHYRRCLQNSNLFCFEKIGTYMNKILHVNKTIIRDYHDNDNEKQWPNVNRAQCKKGKRCSSCIVQEVAEEVYFKDGDLLVGGILPVFNKDSNDPLSCGEIRTSLGTEIVQAMEYAVSLINNKTHPFENVFPNKNIGFVIINSCNQPLLIQNKLISLHKNGIVLDDGTTVDVTSKMIGYVGPYGSTISVASSDALSKLSYVQVSYASTAVSLSDRKTYPYFMRVSTPDDKQATAMIKIIRHSFYNSDYIQVIYSQGTYGEAGRDSIRLVATSEGVCIANEIEIKDNNDANGIIGQLVKFPSAKIVIIFVMSQHVPSVTTALNGRQYGDFLFIGSEAWGYRPNDFIDKQKLAGSLILSLQLPQNNNFTKYLRSIDISAENTNPWLKTYVQHKFDCYLDTSFDKSFTKQCSSNLRLVNQDSYQQEIWTPFALSAMLGLLSGTSDAFRELCGTNSPTLCESYKINPADVRSHVIGQKLDVDGSGNSVSLFDENGDGKVGYTIYNLQGKVDNTNDIIYKEVGMYPLDGKNFVLDVSKIDIPADVKLPSVCPNVVACSACKAKDDETDKPVTNSEGSNAAVPTLGALVGILMVVLVILIVVMVMFYRKNKYSEKEDYNYLDVVNELEPRFYQTTAGNTSQTSVNSSDVQQPNISFVSKHNDPRKSLPPRPSEPKISSVTQRWQYSDEHDSLDNQHSNSRQSVLDPNSITMDPYISPYHEQSNKSDTHLKKVENTSFIQSPPSCALENQHSSETNLKHIINTPETVVVETPEDSVQSKTESTPNLCVDTTDSSANRISATPSSDHTLISPTNRPETPPTLPDNRPKPPPKLHGQLPSAVVKPLENSPTLGQSNRKPPRVAVVPGIPQS